jgi:hypothetical protein
MTTKLFLRPKKEGSSSRCWLQVMRISDDRGSPGPLISAQNGGLDCEQRRPADATFLLLPVDARGFQRVRRRSRGGAGRGGPRPSCRTRGGRRRHTFPERSRGARRKCAPAPAARPTTGSGAAGGGGRRAARTTPSSLLRPAPQQMRLSSCWRSGFLLHRRVYGLELYHGPRTSDAGLSRSWTRSGVRRFDDVYLIYRPPWRIKTTVNDSRRGFIDTDRIVFHSWRDALHSNRSDIVILRFIIVLWVFKLTRLSQDHVTRVPSCSWKLYEPSVRLDPRTSTFY